MLNKKKLSKKIKDTATPANATLFSLMAITSFNYACAAASISSILSTVLNVVGNVFIAIGVFFLVVGIGSLIQALKHEDPDRQQKAITTIVISIVLIGVKPTINLILAATGTGVSIGTDSSLGFLIPYIM